MYCQFCGKELPANANQCPACGRVVGGGPPPVSGRPKPDLGDTVDTLIADTKRAALELASVSARVSKKLLLKADEVAKDPSGSAKNAARRASRELEKARKEIEKALDRLN